ncbi:MAG TPA: 30S ribosomal protein S2 [Candidatus Dojkabacteria bacterium]|nr:30S ribosomal protein S2 [Candidatus Dojkabacteria bacterium]
MAEAKKEVLQKTETKNKSFQMPELLDLLKVGAHFGHKKSAWDPRMEKYIYEVRNGIHIIDLVKTLELLEVAIQKLQHYSERGNILIVGTKGQAATIVEEVAKKSGMFYINRRWPGGLFTNFDAIKKSVQTLVKMEEQIARGGKGLVKKEVLLLQKDVERLNRMYNGIKFMDKLPEAIIVVDSAVEKNAIKEARDMGIPIISLVDTNCNPDIIDYPIPANDDSLKSISLFVNIFGEVVKDSKSSLSVISLRRDNEALLAKLEKEANEEKERIAKMEEEERERMKALREGKIISSSSASVVRVVKKEKDIDAEIKKAEEVKEREDKKEMDDLGLSARIVKLLNEAGLKSVPALKKLSKEELLAIKGIGEKAAADILKAIK